MSLGDGGLYIPLRRSLLRGVGGGAGFKVEPFKLRMIRFGACSFGFRGVRVLLFNIKSPHPPHPYHSEGSSS